jgi:hypothetical protein
MTVEHDTVELVRDFPDDGLRAGDRGTVVYIYDDTKSIEVEFVTGQVVTIDISDVRKVQP